MLLTTKDRIANALDIILTALSNGSGFPAKLQIFTGIAPSTIADAATGTMLVDAPWSNNGDADAFAPTDPVSLIAVANDDGAKVAYQANIITDGTAGYFRILDYDDNAVLQGSVGTVAADLIVNTVDFVEDQPFTLLAASISLLNLDQPYP